MPSSKAYNLSRMSFWEKWSARRRRKAHERYLEERAWQQRLNAAEASESVKDAALNWGVAGQAVSGPGNGL
jgi:hypothetical protein